MDVRMRGLIQALTIAAGYTDDFTSNLSECDWWKRRWFGFVGISDWILQVIVGNVYVRIVFYADDGARPFVVAYRASREHPMFPKTEFYKAGGPDGSPELEWDRKNLEGVMMLLAKLEASIQMEKAA